MPKRTNLAGLGLIALLSCISNAYSNPADTTSSSPTKPAVYINIVSRPEIEQGICPSRNYLEISSKTEELAYEEAEEAEKGANKKTLTEILDSKENKPNGQPTDEIKEGSTSRKLDDILIKYNYPAQDSEKSKLRRRRYIPLQSNSFIDASRAEKRKTNYGQSELVKMIYQAGEEVCGEIYGCRLTVHDISRKNGGKIRVHSSHRNGWDVDVGHIIYDEEKMEYSGRFVPFRTSKPNLTANWRLIRSMADSAGADEKGRRIQIIFWNRNYIRAMREFVTSAYGEEQWKEYGPLLKHEPGHRDHLHFRIRPMTYTEERNT